MKPILDQITVHRKPGHIRRCIIRAGNRSLAGSLGRTGTTVFKREGDGGTPAQTIVRPLWCYWRPDRGMRPRTVLPTRPIGHFDGWCDAPEHPAYNQPVRLPFPVSHETMWRDDCLYDVCVVLDWNMPPRRKRYLGSAIFLHMAKPGFPPTAGCIALRPADLRWLVDRLGPQTRIRVER